jgi:hypothetical protein
LKAEEKNSRDGLMITEQFELIYGTIHCRGKTTYSLGVVDTEEEARLWVKNNQEGKCRPLKIPPDDPVRTCKAAYCPFKGQKPWVSYR